MPPADDPLARLHGRDAFNLVLKEHLASCRPKQGSKSSQPKLAGKPIDLYILFETIRTLRKLPEIPAIFNFTAARALLLLQHGDDDALKAIFARYCIPIFDALEAAVEFKYNALGLNDPNHLWLADRLYIHHVGNITQVHIRDRCESFHESKSIDPEAREERAFLSLPESTQAVIRARLKEASLEKNEKNHPLFKSDEPDWVLLDLRNHIIRMWYRETRKRLGVFTALNDIPSKYHILASRIYTYLECTGVINFGAISVLSPIALCRAMQQDQRRKIAVIGAGMAGLVAARQLRSFGFSVTIYEAKARAGGRVHTDVGTFSAPVDMGAMLITGVLQNPVAVLAHQTNAAMHFMDLACPLFDIDGSWVSKDADAWAEREYNCVLDATNRYRVRERMSGKASDMSLGQAFQKALEKRVSRRKMRLAKYLAKKGIQQAGNSKKRPKKRNPDNNEKLIAIPEDLELNGGATTPMSSPEPSTPESIRQPTENIATSRKKPRVDQKDSPSKSDNSHLTPPSNLIEKPKKAKSLDEKLVSRLLRWHIANLEYACAADVNQVSLEHWDQDDQYGFSGEHVLLKDGYGPLVDGLVGGLERNLNFNHKVQEINYETADGPVELLMKDESGCLKTSSYDSVLVTVPLGVLKRGSIQFNPPLPAEKRDAVNRLGFGGLMKVAMEFPHQFWVKPDMFGALRESVSTRGQFYFFWNMGPCTGKPILVAVVAEPCVEEMEKLPDEKIIQSAMGVLRHCYPDAPYPKKSAVSRWTSDEFTGGAYTYIPVGSDGEVYDMLAAPVGRALFFAGEHTCRDYPTTCASAIISGLREANRILEAHNMIERVADIHLGCLPI